MNIFITGGCGYIGTVLVNKLISKGYFVTVLDNQWFGKHLKDNQNLKIIKDDIRNINKYNFDGFQTFVHLANIANDPSVELNTNLSWEVNVLASHAIMEKIKKSSIKHFVFASSGSVYGVKSEESVTEELSLVPISAYNKTKMISERVIFSYKDHFKIHCIRPATVCGFSPRMRLDLTVNMLTYQALKNKLMTIHGGAQIRPNINIEDITNVFIHFIENPKIESGFYNAGFENLSIIEIAKKIKKKINSDITILPIDDVRSYRLNSDKLINTGFIKKYNIDDAVDQIIEKYNSNDIIDNDKCYTVKWMKKLKL
jgi:nucleoside-diphosphate-sugar epimerase